MSPHGLACALRLPRLLDRPISVLDPERVAEVLDMMVRRAKDGMAPRVVVHEMGCAEEVNHRVIRCGAGEFIDDCPQPGALRDSGCALTAGDETSLQDPAALV